MAFENLQPHQAAILAWREEGLTLGQVAERLMAEHRVSTSPGTLSRYLREVSPRAAGARLDGAGRNVVDSLTILTEILAEVRGRGDEQRMAVEHLAGQIRVLTEVIEETASRPPGPGPQGSRRGGWRGFLVGVVVCAILAVVGYAWVTGVFG